VPFHRFEAAFGHLRSEELQGFRVGETARQGLGDPAGVDAGALGQRHHFGNHQRIAGHDHLVTRLGHLPCPDAAHVRHALAEAQQHRPDAFQVRRIAAHHDCQAAGLGTDHSTGHRRIQPFHAGDAEQRCRHFPRGGRFQAGKIHQQLSAFRPLGDPGRTKNHLAHHGRVRQAQHHHISVLAQLGRCGDLSCASLDQGRALGRIAVPHGQRIARREQAPTHWQAHQADPGKPQRR